MMRVKRALEQCEAFGAAPEQEATAEDIDDLKAVIAELAAEVRQLREENG